MNRQNFYFRQPLMANNMNLLQDSIENSDKNIIKDNIGDGILEGFLITVDSNYDIEIQRGVAYDIDGQRVE
jgi:hypothetical protein